MNTTADTPQPVDPREHERWLDAIVPLTEGAKLAGDISIDTLKREAKSGRYTLIRVSERRLGIRRRDALMIPREPVRSHRVAASAPGARHSRARDGPPGRR